MLDIIAELEKRGIVSSVASRNDPTSLDSLLSHPSLQGRFVAPQVSWEPKSMSVRRIADNLNIGLDAMAFVDDSPFERAEVQYMLPDVLVLSPGEIAEAMDAPAFYPAVSTQESAQRAQMYRQEEERRHAETAFKGDRAGFMAWCEMRLSIAPAHEADLPRIHELTERTHQLNSTGRSYSLEQLRERLHDPRWLMPAARLTDRFGDYGLIGAALVDTQPPWPSRCVARGTGDVVVSRGGAGHTCRPAALDTERGGRCRHEGDKGCVPDQPTEPTNPPPLSPDGLHKGGGRQLSNGRARSIDAPARLPAMASCDG